MVAWSARSGSGSTRTAPGRVPRPDSSAGVELIRSVAVVPGGRPMRARQPQRSTTADMIREPGRPTAAVMSGQASRVRSTRTLARRRRCAHHGTPPTTVPTSRSSGSGGVSGPSAVAAVSHPPLQGGDGDGVAAFDRAQQRRDPRPAQPACDRQRGQRRPTTARTWLSCRIAAGEQQSGGQGERGEFGAVAVADPGGQLDPLDQVGAVVGDQQQRLAAGVAAAQLAPGAAGAAAHRPTSHPRAASPGRARSNGWSSRSACPCWTTSSSARNSRA